MNKLAADAVADLIDRLADYLDVSERRERQEKMAAATARIDTIARNYEMSTGSTFPESLRSKLASLDTDSLDFFLKMSKTAGTTPESLGEPAESTTQKIASHNRDDAEAAFGEWLAS